MSGNPRSSVISSAGTMAQMLRSDLRDKNKRVQLDRPRTGQIPGGLPMAMTSCPEAGDAKDRAR
jgi:hypothetical protein